MTSRKKKGIGYAISGAVFILFAVFNIGFEVTPEWVSQASGIIAVVAGALGFTTVFPDEE